MAAADVWATHCRRALAPAWLPVLGGSGGGQQLSDPAAALLQSWKDVVQGFPDDQKKVFEKDLPLLLAGPSGPPETASRCYKQAAKAND